MKLYGNDFSPNSNKARFGLNAMGVDYEFQTVNLAGGEQRTEAFTSINPVGRVPALVDGDFMIFESNAILRYVAEKIKSPLYPQELKKHALVNQWLDFCSIHIGGAMTKMYFNTIIYKFVNAQRDENSYNEGRKFLTDFCKIIEGQLSKGAYVCGGELTLADIGLLALLDPCEVVGFDLAAFPKIAAWRKTLQAQAFYQKVFPSFAEFLGAAMAKV